MVELVLNGGHHRQMLEAHTGETPKTRNVETQGLVATKTLPKALRTHTLTALTSMFGLVGLVWWVWFGRFGLVGWFGRFGLVCKICILCIF